MNRVGIVRNLDSLGRIVIPKEMRKKLELNEGEPVTITDGDNVIIIKKYRKGCIFCGSEFDIREYKNIWICSKCRKYLNE